MRSTRRHRAGAAAAAAAVASVGLLASSLAAGAAQNIDGPFNYGTISTGDAPFATASNSAGRVVGSGDLEGKDRAYEFFADAPPQLLGEPAGYTGSAAWDINGIGLVVGSAGAVGVGSRGAIWVPDQAPALLPPAADMEGTWAFAINDSNVIVGFGEDLEDNALFAVRWDGPTATVLDNLGEEAAVALDINNAGIAVGYAGGIDNGDQFFPVLWEPGEPAVALPTLGGTLGLASGINDAGQVIGLSTTAGDAAVHLARWTESGVEDLGVPSGAQLVLFGDDPRILGPKINGSGNVSVITNVGGQPTGFAWTDAEGFTQLPPYAGAPALTYPLNIDNVNRIVGVAMAPGDQPAATVWQLAQPDPPTPPSPPNPDPPAPDPGSNTGGGAGNSPAAGATGSGVGDTGAAAPTLPATGPGILAAALASAGALLLAGAVLTAGRRLTPVRVRAGRREGPEPSRDPRP